MHVNMENVHTIQNDDEEVYIIWQNLYESSHSNGEGMSWSYVRLNIQADSSAWILEEGRIKNLLKILRGYILLIFLTLNVASEMRNF